MVCWETHIAASCSSLTTADKRLEVENLAGVVVAHLLVVEEVHVLIILLVNHLIFRHVHEFVAFHEVHEAYYLLVANSDTTASLISHVYIVTLFDKTLESTTHRNYVIIWVRREDYDIFGEWISALRTVGVVCIWLATWPSCDGVLQVIEYLDIAVVCRVIFGDELAESEIVIVLVGELEDRFLGLLAEPNYRAANELVGPLAVGHFPWVIDTGELTSSIKVNHE